MFSELLQTLQLGLTGRGSGGRLARSAVQTVTISLLATLVGFALSVALARGLGTSGYGTYSFALSIAMTLTVGAKLGLANPIVRDIASLLETGEVGRIRSLVLTADRRVLLAGLVLGTSAAIVTLMSGASNLTRDTVLWALLLLPLLGLETSHAAGLRGLGHIPRGHAATPLLRHTLLLGLVIGLMTFDLLSPPTSMALHVVAGVVAVAISSTWILRRVPPAAPSASGWRFGGATTFMGLESLQVLTMHVDILLLGWLLESSDVGIYKVAVSVGLMTTFFGHAAVLVVQPEFARRFSASDRVSLQKLTTAVTRLTSASTVPVLAGFILLGPWFLRAFYGSAFSDAFVPLVVVALGQFVNVLMGPVGTVLNMTGHEGETIKGFAIGAGVTILGILFLAPAFGITGAALAHALATVLWNMWLVRRAQKVLGIETMLFRRSLPTQ